MRTVRTGIIINAAKVPLFESLKTKLSQLSDHLIDSPCIAVCKMDAQNHLCTGCFRTLDEITNWSQLTGEQKHAVNKLAAERKAQAN